MAIDYSKMSVYGNTYGTTEQDLDATQQNQETGIGEILIPNINTPYLNQGGNNEFAKIAAANNNIDYNNLIIPSLKSEQESNMFTDAINKFKSFGDNNKLVSGILKAGSFIKDPITGFITSAIGMLPEQDPRATATKNFYDENFGLTSSGSVASGIMQGYNPVYGSDFLNKISQGIIPESGYGLGPAIDKRIERIQKTIAAKTAKYGGTYDPTYQLEKIQKLQAVRAKEAEALKQVEAATAAAAEKKQQDAKNARDLKTIQQRVAQGDSMSDIGRDMYTGPGQAFEKQSGGSSGIKGTATERNYGGRKDGGRIGYGTGGIVSL